MKNRKSNSNIQCVVAMNMHGISTMVLTSLEDLESLRDDFLYTPDFLWCEGKGKRHLHHQLLNSLKAEDAYFEANLGLANNRNQRWIDFYDDCLIFAVLNSVITGEPMALLHPDCWNGIVKDSKNSFETKRKPTLIPGLPVVYPN